MRNVSLLAVCFTCCYSLVCCSCFGFASGREIHRHLYVTQGVTERCLCDLGLLVVRRGSETRSVAFAALQSTGTSSTLRSRHPLDPPHGFAHRVRPWSSSNSPSLYSPSPGHGYQLQPVVVQLLPVPEYQPLWLAGAAAWTLATVGVPGAIRHDGCGEG